MWVLRLHECALICGDILMALFKISRREFLEGTAAGMMTAGAGGRAAFAADITLGIVYVGPRDDFGWNQAHAVAVKALKVPAGREGRRGGERPGNGCLRQIDGIDGQSRWCEYHSRHFV